MWFRVGIDRVSGKRFCCHRTDPQHYMKYGRQRTRPNWTFIQECVNSPDTDVLFHLSDNLHDDEASAHVELDVIPMNKHQKYTYSHTRGIVYCMVRPDGRAYIGVTHHDFRVDGVNLLG